RRRRRALHQAPVGAAGRYPHPAAVTLPPGPGPAYSFLKTSTPRSSLKPCGKRGFFLVLRRIGGKSGLTGREAGKLVVAKPTIHLSLLSPCILLILPLSGQAMTP